MCFGGFGWWPMFGGLWALLFFIGLVWLIVWAVRRPGRGYTPASKTPLDIARERDAHGEISQKEFEEIKKSLL